MQALAGRTLVWLRLDPVDVGPGALARSLAAAAGRAIEGHDAAFADRVVARVAGGHGVLHGVLLELHAKLPGNTTLVVEDPGGLARAPSIHRLVESTASVGFSLVLVAHAGLPRRLTRSADSVLTSPDLRPPERIVEQLIDEPSLMLSPALRSRIGQLFAHHAALLRDVVDLVAAEGSDDLDRATGRWRRSSSLMGRLTSQLLDHRSSAELEALELATRTGYWDPAFGHVGVRVSRLRPWMIPLADGSWWLRPVWATTLERQLRSVVLRSGQRQVAPAGTHEASAATDAEARAENDDLTVVEAGTGGRRLLQIWFLGPFEVQLEGRPFSPSLSGKPWTIFKYLLAHHPQPVPKEVLMELFWPEGTANSGRQSLHQAIYVLRKGLRRLDPDVPYIVFDNDCYLLAPELTVDSDVHRFVGLVGRGRNAEAVGDVPEAIDAYDQAVRLHRGDYLEEIPYEDWVITERDRLRRLYLDAAHRLGRLLAGQGDHDRLIDLCERAGAVEPLDEEIVRLLMRAHAATGNRAMAIKGYRAFSEALRRQLGLEPTAETEDLYLGLLR